MSYIDKKERFIQAWTRYGSRWGINKTMGQLHAYLLTEMEPLCTEQIMDSLSISRGNVNMNVRHLIDWGLVKKVYLKGDRKEYFVAIKDVKEIAKRIIIQRRKKELEPLLELMQDMNEDADDWKDESVESLAFYELISSIDKMGSQANEMIEKFLTVEEYWLVKALKKWM